MFKTLPAILIASWLLSTPVYAQPRGESKIARSALYLELLGAAVGLSLNYEYFFTDKFSMRWGLGGHSCLCDYGYTTYDVGPLPDEDYSTSTALLILMGNYLSPKFPHHFEAGGGVVYFIDHPKAFVGNKNGDRFMAAFTIGYRYQQRAGGFLFRIGFTPLFFAENMIPSVSVGLGGSF